MNIKYVDKVHADAMVIDAHADIEVPGNESPYVGPDGRSKVAPDKLAQGGVVLAVATGPGSRTTEGNAKARRIADRELAAARQLIADSANNLVLARTATDADEAPAQGKRSIFSSFQNVQIIGTDLASLDAFREAGVTVFALNHIGHNDCADSSRPNFIAANGKYEPDEEHGGLSPLGRKAIRRINELGSPGSLDSLVGAPHGMRSTASSTDTTDIYTAMAECHVPSFDGAPRKPHNISSKLGGEFGAFTLTEAGCDSRRMLTFKM